MNSMTMLHAFHQSAHLAKRATHFTNLPNMRHLTDCIVQITNIHCTVLSMFTARRALNYKLSEQKSQQKSHLMYGKYPTCSKSKSKTSPHISYVTKSQSLFKKLLECNYEILIGYLRGAIGQTRSTTVPLSVIFCVRARANILSIFVRWTTCCRLLSVQCKM